MARTKQRETYGGGSVVPEQVSKTNPDGTTTKVQKRNRQGQLAWRICVSLGIEEYTDEKGRTRKRQVKAPQKVFYGSAKEARAFCKKYSAQFEHIDTSASKMTFSDAVTAWETSMRNAATASQNCMDSYMRNLGHMAAHIGDKTLVEISKQDIESALAAVKRERGLSNTTLHKVFAVTKRVFTYAVDSDWIVRNPCAKIKAPKIDEVTNRSSLSSEECARFRACLDKAEEDAYAAFGEKENRQFDWGVAFGRSCVRGLSGLSCLMALRIELATGLRRSEVLGLTWGAVDFDNNQITVRQKLIVERKEDGTGEAIKIGRPKTKKGTRTLYVEPVTLEHLKRWKAFQASALHMVMPDGKAVAQTRETPVCVGDNGSWLRPASISRWWGTTQEKGFRDEIGFPGLCMHELRHTQATLLLGAGVDLKTVQTRMGHAKASHTLDLYAHCIPANDEAAAAVMGAQMNMPAEPAAKVINIERKTA